MPSVTAGSTDVTLYVYFVDDDGGTAPGEPTTGKLFSNIETGGSASYARQGAVRTDFELFTQTAAGAHTDGGFVLVDDTNMPGLYRIDVPDAAFATGADFVIVQCVMAAANNSIMRPLWVELPDFDLQDATPTVNVTEFVGTTVPTPAITGVPDVNVTHFVDGAAPAPAATGVPDVNATHWIDGAIPAQSITGVPEVDVTHQVGGLVPAPNTTGIPDVNVQEILDTAVSLTTGDLDVNVATITAGAIDAAAFTAAALRQLGGLLLSGTADAGGSSTTIDDAALTEADDIWTGNWVLITSGTSANQCRLITNFDAATDVLTFAPAVSSAIGAGVTYEIYANAGVDVQSWLGTLAAMAAPNALVGGAVEADVVSWLATAAAAPSVAGVPEVDVTHIVGGLVPTPATTGIPDVNVREWLDTAAATPTTAGVPEVDVTHWASGAVPAQSITGVPEVDVTHIVAGLVPTPNTTGVPDVNVQEILDTAVSLTTGDLDVNVATIAAGAVSAAAVGTGAIDADALATDAVNEIARAILPQTNIAYSDIEFLMVLSSDHVTPSTGLTITATRSIDGGAFGAATGTPAEVASGIYQFDASAADMNGTIITFRFTGASSDDTFLTIRTAA